MKIQSKISALTACCALSATPLHAAVTFSSNAFSGIDSGAISTTGMTDWGYVSTNGAFMDDNPVNKAYSALDDGASTVITTVAAGHTAGDVTLTEDGDTLSATNFSGLTFDGNDAYGSFRNFGTTEDAFTINFNNLGVGDFEITLYVGHTNGSRIYDMDYAGTGAAGGTTVMADTIANTQGAFPGILAYTITGSTTDSADVVSLSLGNAAGSGGSGAGFFPGYTVEVIPEPSFALLGGLGALMLLRRRR